MTQEKHNGTYNKIFHSDGVRTVITETKFEISVPATGEVWEQEAVKQLREWCKWRRDQESLREGLCAPK